MLNGLMCVSQLAQGTLVRFLCLAYQCTLSSIKWHIRPCKSFGLCFVTASHMSSILIRYFNNRLSRKVFCNYQELMKTNMELLKECHGTVDWMTLKLDIHDLIMVSFCKACIDFPRYSRLLSEWMERPKTFNELTGIKNPTFYSKMFD